MLASNNASDLTARLQISFSFSFLFLPPFFPSERWAWVLQTVVQSIKFDCTSGVDVVPEWLPLGAIKGKVCVFGDDGPKGGDL